MLNKNFFVLMGFLVFVGVSQHGNTTNIQIWMLQKVSLNTSLMPFPESIAVEFTDESEQEGKLMVKLRSQSEPKTYSFSQSNSLSNPSVQNYGSYSLKEEADVSFSENTIKIDLKWSRINGKGDQIKGDITLGSYEFILNDEQLTFKRTNGIDDDLIHFTAIYSEITSPNETQYTRSWELQKVTLNSDPGNLPESIAIEFTNKNEGHVKVQFPHYEPTIYPFSKLQRTTIRNVYDYDGLLQEDAEISFSGNTIKIDLKQGWLNKEGQVEGDIVPDSFEFVLSDEQLNFKRTFGSRDNNLLIFKAVYSPKN